MNTIGVLTSGGDAPGMNACIAAIASRAEARGVGLRGIFNGFRGLVDANTLPVGSEVSGLARRGGTFLGTSRNGSIEEELRRTGINEACRRCGVDGLIVLGGGGSLRAANMLAEEGVPVVAVPCTIDNDVAGADYTLGFDTAVNKGIRAADEIMDTAESLPERLFLIETLGGTTGHIAIATAYAVGADAVLVHEMPLDIEAVLEKIKARMDSGAVSGLVVLCENLGTADIAARLEAGVGRRARVTALGHAQRGGSPTYFDRMLARKLGEAAADALLDGERGVMTAYRGGFVLLTALAEAVNYTREIDSTTYRSVNAM